MANGVRDHNPTFKAAGRRILVSVLKSLQLLPVAVPEIRGTWLYMDVAHTTRTIGEAGDRVEKRGTDKVTNLKTGVVFVRKFGRRIG